MRRPVWNPTKKKKKHMTFLFSIRQFCNQLRKEMARQKNTPQKWWQIIYIFSSPRMMDRFVVIRKIQASTLCSILTKKLALALVRLAVQHTFPFNLKSNHESKFKKFDREKKTFFLRRKKKCTKFTFTLVDVLEIEMAPIHSDLFQCHSVNDASNYPKKKNPQIMIVS